MKKKLFILYIIIYFLLSTYLSFRYSICLDVGEDAETAKQVFDLNENDDIKMLIEIKEGLVGKIKARYKRHNKVEETEEVRIHQDSEIVQLSNRIARSDIVKWIWRVNILNILLYFCYTNNYYNEKPIQI